MDVRKVAVIGAGTIGRQFAGYFAAEGFSVDIFDQVEAVRKEAATFARTAAKYRLREKLSKKNDVQRGLREIRIAANMKDALKDADYVQESVYEDLNTKRRVLAEIETNVSDESILATSSGGILPSEIASVLKKPSRFLVVHPTTPVHVARVVELVPFPGTSEEILLDVKRLFQENGKAVITLKKEVPGYLINRLYYLMWREVLDLISKDIVEPSEIDLLFCNYLIRWGGGVGPMLQTHIHGGSREMGGISAALDFYARILPPMWKSTATWTEIPPNVRTSVQKAIEEMGSAVTPRKRIVDVRNRNMVRLYRALSIKDLSQLYL